MYSWKKCIIILEEKKNTELHTLKWENLMICELYLHEAVI